MSKFKSYAALEKMLNKSIPIDPLVKVFDPDGEFKLRFAENDTGGAKAWVEEAGWPPHVGIRYGITVEDEVFGKAIEFPCRIV